MKRKTDVVSADAELKLPGYFKGCLTQRSDTRSQSGARKVHNTAKNAFLTTIRRRLRPNCVLRPCWWLLIINIIYIYIYNSMLQKCVGNIIKCWI